MFSMFRYPTAFHGVHSFTPSINEFSASTAMSYGNALDQNAISLAQKGVLPPHSSHPDFGHLTLLVFEAVLEVVCVSLPGYILAKRGLFNQDMQKFAANLNVVLFTPCLIFTKLGSQLTSDKLADLAVIPVIYMIQVAISFLCSIIITKAFRFEKRPRKFVIAMGVFGNSNSLPISLVLSLSQTIKGLHWDKIPGDNDGEVGARGILYLLIFQQLGQLLRWSWGINVLLPKRHGDNEDNEHTNSRMERGQNSRLDLTANECESSSTSLLIPENRDSSMVDDAPCKPLIKKDRNCHLSTSSSRSEQVFDSGEQTPVTNRQHTSSMSSSVSSGNGLFQSSSTNGLLSTPANGNMMLPTTNSTQKDASSIERTPSGDQGTRTTHKEILMSAPITSLRTVALSFSQSVSKGLCSTFEALPRFCQEILMKMHAGFQISWHVIWRSMNPPLFAMGIALIVASIPSLQRLFFSDGTFVKNSITSAIRQSGGVAVPLILVVLGANLARGSSLGDSLEPPEEEQKLETRLLIASLMARMILPTVLMAPLLAIAAKYVPISILDDPIFVIVCFLLAGAPSALQLAQICQLNDVYMGAMTRILFHSYVIWILPSTLILVMCALEVVEWAAK